jgi:hypothetical protein
MGGLTQRGSLSKARRRLAPHVATKFIKYSLMNLREARPSGRSGEQTEGLRTNERSDVVSTVIPCEQVSEAKRRAKQCFANVR